MREERDTIAFSDWLAAVPEALRTDALWRVQVYRMGLYAAEIGWADVTKLASDRRMYSLSDQLCRSLGGISSCIAEGYSRGTGKDRARFYEYALGSAREARDWYYKGRHVLGEERSANRMELLARICKLLLTMIPDERGAAIREEKGRYDTDAP